VASDAEKSRSGRSLWYWVGGAFLFLALLWTAMIFAARSVTIETVPLQSKEVRK
jgi:hypothetical protein